MSDRIDFCQSSVNELAVPAARLSVTVEGVACPQVQVTEVVRAGWPEFSWARLRYNPAACDDPESVPMEQRERMFGMGTRVWIGQEYSAGPAGSGVFCVPVFAGQIEKIESRIDEGGDMFEIVARDAGAVLERITVYGQRLANADGSSAFLTGSDATFNGDGKPNASSEPVTVEGRSYMVFGSTAVQSKYWSYAEVIDYLLSEHLPAGQFDRPSAEQLRALTDNQVVRDLDLTGANLADALGQCCERIGLRYKFVPRPSEAGPAEAIVFYRNGAGREVQLNCQRAGETLSISKTNVAAVHSKKDFWPVTHQYIGQGDFKVFEATFELVEAWDPALEETDYYRFCPSTNPEFYQLRDVYRRWCLNEAGDYSGPPYDQGEAFDLSVVFGAGEHARRPRRFWPALSSDAQGKSLGYFLEVSYDGGINWRQYLYAFDNLLDECGVWLSNDQLDVDTWVAALKGELRFRITASVVSDERVNCVVADGPVGSAVPVVDHLVTLPRQFKYRRVTGQSIFASNADAASGQPDEVDDSAALYAFVRQYAAGSAEPFERADVQTLMVMSHCEPGDRVAIGPDSRDLLGWRTDNRSLCWIERVRMDLEKQCTILRIARRRRWE